MNFDSCTILIYNLFDDLNQVKKKILNRFKGIWARFLGVLTNISDNFFSDFRLLDR